jgi:hypothetical protein
MYTNVPIFSTFPPEDDELEAEKVMADERLEPVEECMDISSQLMNRLATMDSSGYNISLLYCMSLSSCKDPCMNPSNNHLYQTLSFSVGITVRSRTAATFFYCSRFLHQYIDFQCYVQKAFNCIS